MRPSILILALACALAAPFDASPVPPAPVRADATAAKLDSVVASAFPAEGPGAAVLVMRGDDVLLRDARGEADVGADIPIDPGSTFQIASVTKQFAAAGLLTLVDDGRVGLGDPLSKYVPGFPGGDAISIEQLLDHTSGIRNFTSMPGALEGHVSRDLTTAQLIAYFRDEAPDFQPGQGWKYNNSGYVLVGAVIEAVTGQPWHDYLDEALFQPLGMHDTGYAADPAIAPRVVKGYTADAGRPVPPPVKFSLTQAHAAGALASTVDDLAIWNRALHGGRVLKPATYARMITPTGAAQEGDYGFGIGRGTVRGETVLQHSGRMHGYTARLLYIPATRTTVAVLHNSDSPAEGQDPEAVARRLAAVAIGKPYPTVVPLQLGAGELREYEGVYQVDGESTRTLRVEDGVLVSRRGDGDPWPLTPVGQDTFFYADGFTRFTIERDATGAVSAMRFFADGEGDGEVAPLVATAPPAAR